MQFKPPLLMISIMNVIHNMPTTKLIFFAVSKDEWDTKNALVSLWRMYCMYSSMQLSGCDVLAKKNQAHSICNCQVTQVWGHQACS